MSWYTNITVEALHISSSLDYRIVNVSHIYHHVHLHETLVISMSTWFFSTLAFQQPASAATAIFKPPQPLKRVPQRGPPKPTGFTTQTFCSNRQVRKHCLKPDLHLIKTRLPLFTQPFINMCVSVSIHKQLIQTFSQIWESPMLLLGLVEMT